MNEIWVQKKFEGNNFCKDRHEKDGIVMIMFQVTHTFCGTIEYMAPEILTRTGHGKVRLNHELKNIVYF